MSLRRQSLTFLAAIALVSFPGPAQSGLISTCLTTFELHSTSVPAPLFACPQGDTDSFIDQGWWISITIIEAGGGFPVLGIPASDIWLIDSDPLNDIVLCRGSMSSGADSTSNIDGMTTMSISTLAAGGCADGISVVVQGLVLTEPVDCVTPRVVPINVRSPDLDGSLAVDLADLSIFASYYPPGAYDACSDFDLSGQVNVGDLAAFALHYGPPGHSCE